MSSKISEKLKENKTLRVMATIYGLVMFNLGALVIFNKISQPELVIDTNFKIAAACVIVGLIVLFYTRKARPS